jgi:hypothetical protein
VCSDHPTQTTLIDYEAFCGLGAQSDNADGAGADVHAAAAAGR